MARFKEIDKIEYQETLSQLEEIWDSFGNLSTDEDQIILNAIMRFNSPIEHKIKFLIEKLRNCERDLHYLS